VRAKLRDLAKAHGKRFQPDDGWDLLK
jgi:hypothetical protein